MSIENAITLIFTLKRFCLLSCCKVIYVDESIFDITSDQKVTGNYRLSQAIWQYDRLIYDEFLFWPLWNKCP